jgi:hypothetical protein
VIAITRDSPDKSRARSSSRNLLEGWSGRMKYCGETTPTGHLTLAVRCGCGRLDAMLN